MDIEPGYESLAAVLQAALDQAQKGKGVERHANGKAFEDQPILSIQDLVGPGYALGQAIKKAQESQRLPMPQAERDLLGAINYLAAVVLYRRRMDKPQVKTIGPEVQAFFLDGIDYGHGAL